MLILGNYELNKLDHVQQILDKNVRTIAQKCGRSIEQFESEILHFYEGSETTREIEIGHAANAIRHVVSALKSKIDLLKHKKITQITDFSAFKHEMVQIQENIFEIKKSNKSALSQLKAIETELEDELNLYYNAKLPEWNQEISFCNFEFVPSKVKASTGAQSKEVKQFFDFVHQSGGHENGWRKEDHQLFLKLRGKCKRVDEVATQIHETLPDISIEEVKSHEEWYKKYLNLQTKKKAAINKWKQSKTIEKLTNNVIVNETERGGKKVVQEENLKDKLLQWKMEREEKLLTEQEMEKQKILCQIENERLKRQKQIERKKIVNEWREAKKTFEQTKRQQQRIYEDIEKRRRATNANKLIKEFQTMDELYILKMRQIHKKITDEPKKRIQSGPPVFRDPKRVLKPTIQWAHRVQAAREPLCGPLPIFATPKLAIPEWRKSIN
ncbi:coiled-coil domain-containing protein 112-like [Anthonomus grandis grandis]|uniref:coiled-coil domain-containing protein 112-like n=1 Tax=Anthonomus grandis grandis TaxID=2921223 RepID=UPI00216561A6|nr:coiled-coil domain-containing protein 112-like [Anthonomus grandis grandis]